MSLGEISQGISFQWFFLWISGDVRDVGSISELGRSPGGGHGNPLQYSCLENPMDRGAWWATVHGVTKSQTQLKLLSTHTRIHIIQSNV